MAKGRKVKEPMTTKTKLALAALVIAIGAAAYFLLEADDAVLSSERTYVPVSGFSDVHGLAVDPADQHTAYVATHHGLMRVSNGTIERVGDMQDDLMGFTMHPADSGTFWTSGHPRTGGNMGVRLSTDDGFTWTTIWSEKVDFHAMTVSPADPQHLWGYYAGKLYESTDGGHAWSVANPTPPSIRALAADPHAEATLYATTSAGISTSADAGRTWMTLDGIPALGVALDPKNEDVLYAGGKNALWKSTDGGVTFTSLTLPGAGSYAYLSVSGTDPNVVYAVTYETGLYKTSDGGATWTTLKPPSR